MGTDGAFFVCAMPFEIRKSGDRYCVYTQGAGGKNHGCHDTEAEAKAQMRALYANVPEARNSAFSKSTKAEREKMPESDFAGPNRSFPIMDQNDVNDAARLIGHASDPAAVKARVISIAKRKGLKLPDAWQTDAKHSAAFALDTAEPDGDLVIRRGKIFEAGDYPDKGFALTPEEMLLAVAEFEPVPNDLEHTDTILDGQLGQLRAVTISDDGLTLNGEVAIPKWLHDLAPNEPLKVSTTWDRETKRLIGNALVLQPRVSDAAVMSAYAEFASTRKNTRSGQAGLQAIHDVTTEHGAVCEVQMASRHEKSTIQTVHDMAVDHGATCDDKAEMTRTGAVKDEGAKMADEKAPSWLEGFKNWLHGDNADGQKGASPPASAPAQSTTADADARFSALEVQLAEERGKRFAAEAAAFADRVIPSRAMPAERATIVALHTQAAADDARDPQQVTFGVSADKQPLAGSRVQAFEAAYLSRPESLMTHDSVPAVMPDGSVVLSTSQGGSEDELKQVREQAAAWARANGLAGNGAKK